MAQRRCPELDLLAYQLLEAYRGFDRASSAEESIRADEELVRVHRCLSAHRAGCLLCKFPNPLQDQGEFLDHLDDLAEDLEEFHAVDPPLRWRQKVNTTYQHRTKRS